MGWDFMHRMSKKTIIVHLPISSKELKLQDVVIMTGSIPFCFLILPVFIIWKMIAQDWNMLLNVMNWDMNGKILIWFIVVQPIPLICIIWRVTIIQHWNIFRRRSSPWCRMTFMINQTFTIFMDIFCINWIKMMKRWFFSGRLWIWKNREIFLQWWILIWAMPKF